MEGEIIASTMRMTPISNIFSGEQKCMIVLSNKYESRQKAVSRQQGDTSNVKGTGKGQQQKQGEQLLKKEDEGQRQPPPPKRDLPGLKTDIYRILRAALIAESTLRPCTGSDRVPRYPRLLSLLIVTDRGCDTFLTSTDNLQVSAPLEDGAQKETLVADAQSEAVAKQLIAIRKDPSHRLDAEAVAKVRIEGVDGPAPGERLSTLYQLTDSTPLRINVTQRHRTQTKGGDDGTTGFSVDLYRSTNAGSPTSLEGQLEEKLQTVDCIETFMLQRNFMTEILSAVRGDVVGRPIMLVNVNSRNGPAEGRNSKIPVSGDEILLDMLQFPNSASHPPTIQQQQQMTKEDDDKEKKGGKKKSASLSFNGSNSYSTAFVVCFSWHEELKKLTLGKIMVHRKEVEAARVYRELLQEQRILCDSRRAAFEATIGSLDCFSSMSLSIDDLLVFGDCDAIFCGEENERDPVATTFPELASSDSLPMPAQNGYHHDREMIEEETRPLSPAERDVNQVEGNSRMEDDDGNNNESQQEQLTAGTACELLRKPATSYEALDTLLLSTNVEDPSELTLSEYPYLEDFFDSLPVGTLCAVIVVLNTYYAAMKEDHNFWKTLADYSRQRTCYLLLWQPPSDVISSARKFRELRDASRLNEEQTIPNFPVATIVGDEEGEEEKKGGPGMMKGEPVWMKWERIFERYKDSEMRSAILMAAASSSEMLDKTMQSFSQWPLACSVSSDCLLRPNTLPSLPSAVKCTEKKRQHYLWNLTEFLYSGLPCKGVISEEVSFPVSPAFITCYIEKRINDSELEFFRNLLCHGKESAASIAPTMMQKCRPGGGQQQLHSLALMVGAADGGPEFRHFELVARRLSAYDCMSRVMFQDDGNQMGPISSASSSFSSVEVVPLSQSPSRLQRPPRPTTVEMLDDEHLPRASTLTNKKKSCWDVCRGNGKRSCPSTVVDAPENTGGAKRRLLNDGSTRAGSSTTIVPLSSSRTHPFRPPLTAKTPAIKTLNDEQRPLAVPQQQQQLQQDQQRMQATVNYNIYCNNQSKRRPFADETFKQTTMDVIHLYMTVRGSNAQKFDSSMWYADGSKEKTETTVDTTNLLKLESQLRLGELFRSDDKGKLRFFRLDMRYSWLFLLLCAPPKTSGAVRSLALKYAKFGHNMALSHTIAMSLVERAISNDDEVAALFRKGLQGTSMGGVPLFEEDYFREGCIGFAQEKMRKALERGYRPAPSTIKSFFAPVPRCAAAAAAANTTTATTTSTSSPVTVVDLIEEGENLQFDEAVPIKHVTIKGSSDVLHAAITKTTLTVNKVSNAVAAATKLTKPTATAFNQITLESSFLPQTNKNWKHNQPAVTFQRSDFSAVGQQKIAVMLMESMNVNQKADFEHLFEKLIDENSAILIVCNTADGRSFFESFKPERIFAINSINWILVKVDNRWRSALLVESPIWRRNPSSRELGPQAFDNLPLFENLEHICGIYRLKWFYLTM